MAKVGVRAALGAIGVLALLALIFSQQRGGAPAAEGEAPAQASPASVSVLSPWPFGEAPVARLMCRPVEVGLARPVDELYIWVGGGFYALNGIARDRLEMPLVETAYPDTPDLIARARSVCGPVGELRSAELSPG